MAYNGWLSATVRGGDQLQAALSELPKVLQRKILKRVIRASGKDLMKAQKAAMPKGGKPRYSYDKAGNKHYRLPGYSSKMIVIRTRKKKKKGEYCDIIQYKDEGLLVTHSVRKNYDQLKSEVLSWRFSKKKWKMVAAKRTHGYEAGQRQYFYPASIEYGFTARNGRKIPGRKYLSGTAKQKAPTLFATISDSLHKEILAHMRGYTQKTAPGTVMG